MKNLTSMMVLGIVMIILGIVSISSPAFMGSAVVLIIGIALLLAGLTEFIQGLKAEFWREKLMPLILGIITGLCGILVIGHPLLGLGFLTVLLIVFFMTEGIWKIITSFSYRPASGWLGMLIGGFVSLVLGILIWRQWPLSGVWAFGVLIGIDLVVTGISIAVLAFTLRRITKIKAL